jgi:polyisoprenoid-binding protein YceI
MHLKKRLIATLLAGIVVPALAAVSKYEVDPSHTYPSLEFSHMGLSIWRGKFDRTSGSVIIDRAARTGTASIVIDTASINFGLDKMDEHARSEDWFNVTKFPTATYQGTLKFVGDTPRTVDGQLTLLGVTRPVKLTINLFNCMPHPMLKKEVCGADAEGDLHWSEFGMRKYGEGDTDKVRLRIQVEALKQD